MVASRQHNAPVRCACAGALQLHGLDLRLPPHHAFQRDWLGCLLRPVARHQVIGGALRWHGGVLVLLHRLPLGVLSLLAFCRCAWMGHRRRCEHPALGRRLWPAPRLDARRQEVYLGVVWTRCRPAARYGAAAEGEERSRSCTGGTMRRRRGGRGACRPSAVRSHQPARHDLWLRQRSPGHEPPRPTRLASSGEGPSVSDGWLRGRRSATCGQLWRASRERRDRRARGPGPRDLELGVRKRRRYPP